MRDPSQSAPCAERSLSSCRVLLSRDRCFASQPRFAPWRAGCRAESRRRSRWRRRAFRQLPASNSPQVFAAQGARKMRVALLNGCVQTVVDTSINAATIRLLTRHGVEVVVAKGAGCCGALPHHLGKVDKSLRYARANIDAWTREINSGGLDHIIVNASGCGTSVKDYGHMFRNDPTLADKAAHISAMTKDVTELMTEIGFAPSGDAPKLRVAYHSACSLQHGQKISQEPIALLTAAGFNVVAVPEGHICCGSAGTYNVLQPKLADALRSRKVANIESVAPDIVAAGNIGCIVQVRSGTPSQSSTQWNCSTGRAGGRSPRCSANARTQQYPSPHSCSRGRWRGRVRRRRAARRRHSSHPRECGAFCR